MRTPLVAVAAALAAAAATPAAARPIAEVARDPRVVIETTVQARMDMPAGKTVNGESDGSDAPARAQRIRLAAYPTDLRPTDERGR